jgi:uncharacterized protein (DUF433 family)
LTRSIGNPSKLARSRAGRSGNQKTARAPDSAKAFQLPARRRSAGGSSGLLKPKESRKIGAARLFTAGEIKLMATVTTTLIELDAQGVARIAGTNTKVIEVALDKLAHGSSPEEMHFQYPHLSLAQIHAALAYYYEHQTALDAEIQRRWMEVNELAARAADSPLQRRLRELKERR